METNLETAVIIQLGYEDGEVSEACVCELQDVNENGANCGTSGFIYSHEMLEFYKANKNSILEHLKRQAEELNGNNNVADLLLGYQCLKGQDVSAWDIAEILNGNYEHEMSNVIIDAVCWGLLEDVARLHCD